MESIKYRSSKWAGSTFASGSVIPSLPRLHNAHSRGNKNIVNFWQFNWKQVKENCGKQRKEREKTELTSRERFDRFTHYVANIYGTTNGLTDKRGAWPGVDRVEGLRTDFRVVTRASSSTTRRVVKFEFATAKWATTTTTTKRNEMKRVTRQAKGQRSL